MDEPLLWNHLASPKGSWSSGVFDVPEEISSQSKICKAFSRRHSVLHTPTQLPSPCFATGGTPFLGEFTGASADTRRRQCPLSPTATLSQPQKVLPEEVALCAEDSENFSPGAKHLHGSIYGTINFIICVPTLISYAAIVFRLREFSPNMTTLTKMFFFSSAVHQAVFTVLSSLPFAVGQVQDVGLIFLSQIATSVYRKAVLHGHTNNEATATVLVACAISTGVTGLGVWLVGKFKLSCYVQLLPLPVIGGYLGYIGYFCLAAGASLGTGRTIDGFGTWAQVFVLDAELWAKLLCSLCFALIIFYIAYKVDHVAALPGILVVAPFLFLGILVLTGTSLEEARSSGWIPNPNEHPAMGWQCFELYNDFEGLAWEVLPSEIPTAIGLFCVVCFGSVLDIAAIATEQPKPVNFDEELRMIGFANVASGLSGGYTGSYIFSQTIFSQRQKVTSTINGWIIAVGEFLLFLLPIDVLQFFPGCYIGGIMAFFGFDIMLDWLWHSRSKVSLHEYFLLILTFFMVMFLGVIEGCVAGVIACAFVFIIVYSSTPVVEIRQGVASTAMRSFDERAFLLDFRRQILCIELRGYLFFGASLQVSDNLLRRVEDTAATWVVMDFTHVTGIDSTSARAIAKFVCSLRSNSVRVALSGASRKLQVHRLLYENGAFPTESDLLMDQARLSETLDDALRWCEVFALKGAGFVPPEPCSKQVSLDNNEDDAPLTLPVRLRAPQGAGKTCSYIELVMTLLAEFIAPLPGASNTDLENASAVPTQYVTGLEKLARSLEDRVLKPNEVIFTIGERCDRFMLLVAGTVVEERPSDAAEEKESLITKSYEQGSLLADVDFYLGAPHRYTARAGGLGCRVAILTREAASSLEVTDPPTALLTQRIALRSVCLLAESMFALFARSTDTRRRSLV